MRVSEAIINATGLPAEEREMLRNLLRVHAAHDAKNARKRRYYEGHVPLGEVNLGIALPDSMRDLEIGCAWGEKTVDVLAARSQFDGFVGRNGADADAITRIAEANQLRTEYDRACRDELKYGCTFATLSADPVIGCKIRWHSPETAAAIWDGEKGRIAYGMAVTALEPLDDGQEPTVCAVNLHTDGDIWLLRRDPRKDVWRAERLPHEMGRPLMEPMAWNATSAKPFGRSRLKKPVRELIKSYVRTVANASIALEFSTAPQKYLLGLTDDQYDALSDSKFRTYVGSVVMSTQNPETGSNPVFGQLQQGSLEPHVQMMRMIATQFSAATGLTVTDVGVVNDANPTSSEAILAQSGTLILMAQQLNEGNANALRNIAIMAQAIARNVLPSELTEAELDVLPHFKNPAMPSVSVTADAAVKIASTRPEFAQTDVYLEMIGFSPAEIRRIKAQESRARGLTVLQTEFADTEDAE